MSSMGFALPATGWGEVAASEVERLGALLVGPGLGSEAEAEVDRLLALDRPLVIDGDALHRQLPRRLPNRVHPTILTPHDGEFRRLGGFDTGDRVADTRALAAACGAVVLRKGPTSVIAGPDGRVRLVANGDQSLATAGTGDVLAGMVLAAVGRGTPALEAASAAAWVHAEAGRGQPGLVASDLPERIRAVLSSS